MTAHRPKVAVVGRGRVGRGLHGALVAAGVDAELVGGRRPGRAALGDVEVVILAVPDGAIGEVAAALAPRTPEGAVFLHCAGSLGAEAFPPTLGRPAGAMHPLVSFAHPKKPPSLAGTTFALAGPAAARRAGRALAEAVGARPLERGVDGVHGPAYHAAAALAANGAAALATVAVEVLETLGARPKAARRAVGALLRTVAENVERVGVPDALTGPVMRGDAGTVRRHREALAARSEAALGAYGAIAPAILRTARAVGLPEASARAVRSALQRKRK